MFHSKKALWLFILFFGATVLFTGCEKKEQPAATTTTPPADTVQTPPAPVAPALSGNWTGKFYDRKMTLKITSQTGNDFEGETTINWKKPLTSKVSGKIDPATMALNFSTDMQSSDPGTYEGTLSSDGKSFTGKFTPAGKGSRTFDVTLKMD